MSPVLVVGAGSCIIQAILDHFATIPGISERAELHLSQFLPGGRTPVPVDKLVRCAILIEEAAPWQGSGTLADAERALLSASCARITVPTLHFNSLWPLMAEDPRNVPEPGAPYGRIPFGMGDRLALKIIQAEPDAAARRAAYDAADFAGTVNLARSHELEARNCFAREQGCDVRVAGYVMSHFREKRLYYTHNHPTGELMYFVLAQLFAVPAIRDLIRQPYDVLVEGARRWATASNVFAGEEAPVHPAVAEYFGLRWWRRDHRYLWMGQGRTFDQWIDWYLSYVPALPALPVAPAAPAAAAPLAVAAPAVMPGARVPAGQWLQGIVHDRRIAPATRRLMPAQSIDRVPFLVSSPIDTSVARFGKYFLDPEYRRYRAIDTLLAWLPGATVLGCEGVVVFEGTVVQDTMRHLTANEAAPVIRSLSPQGLVLQERVSIRQLPGSYMVGHSGLWRDYLHWMQEALPRLVAFLQERVARPGLKLLLPSLPPGSLQAQTLDLLGIDRAWVEEVAADEVLACEQLATTSAFDLWSVPPYCRHAAERLVERAEASGGLAGGSAAAPGPVVFIQNGGAPPRIRNFDALAAALQGRGAGLADVGTMSLVQLIAAMRQARVVVAEHGAGLANILFCRPGTSVIELFNPASVQPGYWSMASCCGLGYGFLVGAHVPSDRYPRPDPNGDYEVPVEALLRALDSLTDRAAAGA
jgi:capsular polysaccharide biosynthesis protein